MTADILCINVESEPELELLSRLAVETGKTARISVRVNPDVDAGTHAKISTGKSENKFGIPIARARAVYARAAKLPGIEVTGIDMHIGSQITDLGRLETAFRILSDFVQTLRADGHTISHIDFGGGLGIPYHMDREAPPAPAAYAAMVKRVTHNLGCTLMFEPGRMIVGNAGILVTRVIYVKPGDAKNFVIIDAAMNDLIRPTLYEAHHDILPVREAAAGARIITADVVGPVCETGDYLALDRKLPEPKAGDLLAIMTAGAYGAVQSGTYNTRAAGAGSAGQGRPIRGGAAAHRGRGADRDGQAGAVAVKCRNASRRPGSWPGRRSCSLRRVAAFAPPTTTPAAFSIGLIAEVKSNSGAHVADHDFPEPADRFGDFHRQPQRLHFLEAEPHVLHHQPGGKTEIEAARQDRARKLVAARGVRCPIRH